MIFQHLVEDEFHLIKGWNTGDVFNPLEGYEFHAKDGVFLCMIFQHLVDEWSVDFSQL
jgi:hypothetical protein